MRAARSRRRSGGLRALGWAVLVAPLACASAARSSLDTVVPSLAAEEACRRAAVGLCARAQSCALAAQVFVFDDPGSCEDRTYATCLARYDGPGAAPFPSDCAAEITRATCHELVSPTTALFGEALLDVCPVSAGSFTDDAPCLRDGDCRSGACAATRTGACGRCVAQRREGESCLDVRCAAPLACIEGRCVQRAADGASCTQPFACRSGLCKEGRCKAGASHGEPCGPARDECDLSATAVCGPDLVCAALTIARAGEPCVLAGLSIPEPGTRLCTASAICEHAVCVAAPGWGEVCTTTCREGLSCRGGVCVRAGRGGPALRHCTPD